MLAIILSKIIFAGNVNFTEEYYIYTYIPSTLKQVLCNTCIYFEFGSELIKKFDIIKKIDVSNSSLCEFRFSLFLLLLSRL